MSHVTVAHRFPLTLLLRSAVILLFVCLSINLAEASTSSTDGQTPLALQPGAPAGSYALSGFDNVNLFNGSLNFRLLLAAMSGRGGAGDAIMLPIERKWRVSDVAIPQLDGSFRHVYIPVPNWWETMALNYSPGVLQGRQAGYDTLDCPDGTTIFPLTLTRLTFTAPDGTEYELRDQLTGGQPHNNACVSTVSRGTVFITADGTAATFTSDTTIYDQVISPGGTLLLNPSGYLMLRDGTRYRVDNGLVSWLRDRNGNKMSFTYDGNQRVVSIKDSLNRVISVSYGGSSDQITFKGFGGATRTIQVNYASMSTVLRSGYSIKKYGGTNGLFPELNGASSSTDYNPTVVSSVTLPNNQQYQFLYDSYGELARVVLPTGGAFEYDYATGVVNGNASGVFCCGVDGGFNVYRRVIERRIYSDGATLESKMTYSRPEDVSGGNQGYVLADHYKADGTRLSQEKHYFYGKATASFLLSPVDYPVWNDGREYQTDAIAADGSTVLRTAVNTWQQGVIVSSWNTSIPNNPRISVTTSTLKDVSPNLVSKQTFGYDDTLPYNNQNNVKEYDFGSGVPGALVRETRTTFITSSTYTGTSVHLRSLASQVSVYDAGGTERARTTMEYDNYASDTNHAGLLNRTSISGLDSSFTTSYTTRGNATATTHYLLVNGSVTGSVTGYAQYDIAGNVLKAIDARGNATTITYDDCFGAPDGEATINTSPFELSSIGQASYAFPTVVTNAANQTVNSQFDYYLGRPVDARDTNGVVASGYYSDALDRPTQVRRAVGVSGVENQTTFAYDDATRTVTTTSDLTANNDNALVGKVLYDGLGRTTEARQYEGGTNYIATQTQYDAMGRAFKTSNPFRPWQSETAVWITSAFDALSRVTSVTTPDSAVVTTAYSGNTVTVTDQIGKARKSVTDGLGRLIQVYEDPAGLNYLTSYSYDTLDNLTSVSQGSQTRTFVYDSLKRLSSAANPESATISYQYDNNGNLTSKTDARSVTTTFVYDSLNRATSRSYSDGTPTVTYAYDPNIANGKGRLSSVSSSVSTYNYSSYDALGRVLGGNQTLGNQTYLMSYTYDLAGHLLTQNYPSGRTVTNAYDGAGRTTSVTGNLGDGATRTYSTGIIYSSLGGMTKEQFGTTTPIYNKLFYNSRGQLSEIRESTSYTGPTDTTWDRGAIINHYSNSCWGMCGGSGSTTSMTDNNGNLKKQDVYIPGSDMFTQFYAYDALNRLQKVNESKNGAPVTWQQQYGYDRYANRTIDQTNTWGTGIPKPNFGVDAVTNRLTAPAGFTMSYDAAGNLTFDNSDGFGGTRTYDAENRMKQAWANNQWQAYTYDGDGRRVKRIVNGTETWQVYGLGGELLAEYAANAAASAPQREYGYRNGQLLITADAGSGGNSLSVNGSSGYLEAANSASLNITGSAITLEAWVKMPTTNTGSYQIILEKAPAFGTEGGYELSITDQGKARIDIYYGAYYVGLIGNTVLSANTWHHVAGVYNGSQLQVYVDGALDNGLSTSVTITSTSMSLLIGESRYPYGHSYFNGLIDEVRVSNAVLYTANFTPQTHLTASSSTKGLWKFDGSTPNDSSGNGNNGTLNGGATYSSDVPGGGGGGGGAQIRWLVTDQLGTPRMVFDQTGSLASVSRHDYLPFGEEIYAGIGGRTSAQGYTLSDTVRQKFTSKERDNETGLDYFGARYYSSVQGRFTSVDIAGPDLINPQSLNKYAYTLNNPLRYVDPKGLYEEDVHLQLTYALGLAAGFTANDAWNIALGDQGVDDDPNRSPWAGPEARRKYHFTTEERRDELWGDFLSVAGAYTGPSNSNVSALDSLGTFLHADQDSYSHRGFGPILGQGWPPWTGTAPDKTYNAPRRADRMAEDTYNRLTTAATVLYNNHKISFHYKPLEWKVISPLVQAFNRARTPEEKQKALNQIKALAQENLQRQAQEAIRKEEEKKRRKHSQ